MTTSRLAAALAACALAATARADVSAPAPPTRRAPEGWRAACDVAFRHARAEAVRRAPTLGAGEIRFLQWMTADGDDGAQSIEFILDADHGDEFYAGIATPANARFARRPTHRAKTVERLFQRGTYVAWIESSAPAKLAQLFDAVFAPAIDACLAANR